MTSLPGLQGLRVFLVEDEIIVALELESVLSDAGCEIIGPVYTLAEAMKLAPEAAMDAAILDVNLHGEMSFGLAEQLAARGVKVVLTTGYDDVSLPPELRLLPRVTKPFTGEELRSELIALVGKG